MQRDECKEDETVRHPFERLIDRSMEFESSLEDCFSDSIFFLAQETEKHKLCAAACELSIEHPSMVRLAFSTLAPSSGTALIRLQYEALLKAAWILFAASELEIDKLSRELTFESEQAAKNLPGSAIMLADVTKLAPEGLSAPLSDFSRNTRHLLNSFVHTGIHPLRRTEEGFPMQLAQQLVLVSNGLLHLAYRMLAVLTGSQRRMDKVTRMFRLRTDVLPVIDGQSGADPMDR